MTSDGLPATQDGRGQRGTAADHEPELAGGALPSPLLLLRRRAGSFPIFTALISFNILRSIALYLTLRLTSSGTYFYTYWTLALLDVALQLAIVFELAAQVFRPLGVWAPQVRQGFILAASASLLIASSLAWLATPVTRTLRQAIVIRGDFFSSVLMSELFVAMVILSVTLGLPWRTHVGRLAQGLGIYELFCILTDTAYTCLASGRTNETYKLLTHLQMAVYLIALTYWIVTLALPEPELKKFPEHLHQELRALQRRAALTLQTLRANRSAS